MADSKDNAPRRKTLDQMLEITKQRGAAGLEMAEQKAAETPRQMFLPGFDIGAFPNHLNRSSFIAPIARGRRKFHRQTEMVTRKDCVLEYTGEQLDEADGDLIMALIAFAQPYPIGTPVPLHRAELLRKLTRSNGKTQYEWLHRRIKALTEATLFLEAKKPDGSTRYSIGKTVSFRIVSGFTYDDDAETYSYSIDPRWVQMFGNREYSLIDWDKRMQIARGQDMAKTLQRLVATSADQVQRYALDWLKDKMEYAGRMRDFRDAITRAVNELERLEIASGRIEDSTKGKPQLVLHLQTVA
ncbi:hypothetical protein ACFDR9_004966 [Janthinobacterium sp. CG_23.3]|jgi:hypothetical protein|uniref:plasmid-related transcriptional repressor protein n=1 Tax=Janthinobacterium sp. CG_23.3 TaxID=3349634 RepID=UPI0038D3E4DE